jgi:hypothetical protein
MQVKLSAERRQDVFAFAVGLLLLFLTFILPVTGGFARIPGDLGDARFNSVILEHVFRWMTGHEASLWSPGFFFPFRDVLAFSDNHFGTVAIYGLARLVGFDREHAYLIWFAIGELLNFVAMFYVMRRSGFGALAAACAAFLFAAGLPTIFKTAHAQLTYRFAVPLAFWFVYSWMDDADPRKLLAGIVFFVWQFFCSIYLGVFLFYALALLVSARFSSWSGGSASFSELARGWRENRRKSLWLLVLVLAGSFSLASMLSKYAAVGSAYGLSRSPAEIYPMLPVPGSYLINDQSTLYAWLGAGVSVPMRHEHQMLIGVVAGLLVLVGAVTAFRRDAFPVARVAVLMLAGLIIFTMNFGGHTLYSLVIALPGLSSVRAVARVVLVMMLPASILAAWAVQQGCDWLVKLGRRRWATCFGLTCLALLGYEVFSVRHFNAPVSEWKARETAVLQKLPAHIGRDHILLVTWGQFGRKLLFELDGMVAAQDMGISTLNGYSGNFPTQSWQETAWGDDCTSAHKRLAEFAAFAPHGQAMGRLAQIEEHVLTVSPDRCIPGQVVPEDLSPQLIRDIHLLPRMDEKGHAEVAITNDSVLPFSSLTRLGPVRLSWRFVPARASGTGVTWDPRLDLDFYLKPGDSTEVTFDVSRPSMPGEYLFEVSLVQEGVRWLHENGMSVGALSVKVN